MLSVCLAKFKFAGQNLAWAGSTEPPAEEEFIKEMIRRWFIEYKDADMSYIQSYRHYSSPKPG